MYIKGLFPIINKIVASPVKMAPIMSDFFSPILSPIRPVGISNIKTAKEKIANRLVICDLLKP